MNHFLALRPAPVVRDRLAAVQDRLRAWNLPAAWVHPEDLHCTLLFLGQRDDDEAQWLPTLVEDVARSARVTGLQLTGMGAKGGRHEPQVVYVALADAQESCNGLHRDLAEVLDQEPERAFLPHITLCRPRTARPGDERPASNASWPALLEAHGLAEWGACPMESLVLWRRTEDVRRTTRYEELASWPLATR